MNRFNADALAGQQDSSEQSDDEKDSQS
jgi:hypothetical protein